MDVASRFPDARWRRLAASVASAGLLVLTICCFAPALRAYYAVDDYLFLAISRLLQQPWSLFVNNHYPGSEYFRPFGLFFWWSVTGFAKASAPMQYAANLALHLCGAGALYALLQRLSKNALANVFWTGLYAVHPLAIGTALWLSARFDLLSTFFSLLAVNLAIAYAQRPRVATLLALLSFLLLALMSKEAGVIACAVAWITIAFAPRSDLNWVRRGLPLGLIALLTLGWIAYRAWMLSSSGVETNEVPTWTVLFQGLGRWLALGATYLFSDPRMPAWGKILVGLAMPFWLMGLVLRMRRSSLVGSISWGVIGALLALVVLPGILQAPIALPNSEVIARDPFNQLIYFSRQYELSLAGLVCLLMLLTRPGARVAAPGEFSTMRSTGLNFVAGFFLLLATSPVSHAIAHGYASRTREQAALHRAIESTLAAADLPEHGCRIYLLSVPDTHYFPGYSDSIAKGLAASPERLAHCLIQTERTPWAHFVRQGSIAPIDWSPMQPLRRRGKPIPWPEFGGIEVAYLNLEPEADARNDAHGLYFEYRDGRFVDISADVREGRREVHFFNARPGQR